jgi:hypothetical protein
VRITSRAVPPAEETDRRAGPLAAVIFAVLVVAVLGAFAFAQKRKGEPLILDRVVFGYPNKPLGNAFTPNGDGCADRGRIRFRVTVSDRGDIQVVTPDERLVRTLASDLELPSYTYFEFNWDGENGRGKPVPSGRYKLRITLQEQDRELTTRGRLLLHRIPPRRSCAAPRSAGG